MKRILGFFCAALLIVFVAACTSAQLPAVASAEIWRVPENAVSLSYDESVGQDVLSYDTMRIGIVGGGEQFSLLRLRLKGTWLADEVESARLFLKVIDGTPPSSLKIGVVTDSWGDGNLTCAESRALVDVSSVKLVDARDEGGGWISADVTDIVKSWLRCDMPNNGFALFGAVDGQTVVIDTDDSVEADGNFPYLEVKGAIGERDLSYGKFGYVQQPSEGLNISESGNCMAYSLRDTNAILDFNLGIDDDEMNRLFVEEGGEAAVADYTADLVERYVAENADGLKISSFRRLDDFDSEIDPSKEYRIAMRVGCKAGNDGTVDLGISKNYDFHFWAQLSDGQWAQKFPADESEIIPNSGPGISPDACPWNSALMWNFTGSNGYYTSKIYYWAVTKDTEEFTRHYRLPMPDGLSSPSMDFELADSSTIQVKYFNFGEGELKNSSGETVPCPLDGIVAAPASEGPHPLVILLHGVAPIEDAYTKTYEGFDYLVKQLAAEGYVALSFNVNIEYDCFKYGESIGYEWAYSVYKQQLAQLERANAGREAGYGLDLTGMIDFSEIHMIGHSRGAEMAYEFILKERAEGLNRVKSLVRLAGTMLRYEEPSIDIPTGIVIAEFDGDVPEDGQIVFDDIQKETGRATPASLVFLHGGNHAYFNRKFTWEHEPKDGRATEEKLLTRESQEDFTAHYVSAFLSVYSKGEQPFGIWDVKSAGVDFMFDHHVTTSYYAPGRLSLLKVSEAEAARLSTSGALSADFAEQGRNKIFFNHPGGNSNEGTLPLYRISWTAKRSSLSIPVAFNNFSDYSSISLYMAVDSSDPLNAEGEGQTLNIWLKDASGAQIGVSVPSWSSVLRWNTGFIKHYDGDEYSAASDAWVGVMPLGELRIPLTYFESIDLSAVTEIIITPDGNASGAVMLSGAFLQ